MRHLLAALALGLHALAAPAATLPDPVREALARQGIAPNAVSLWARPADGAAALWEHEADRPRNPASVMKLLVTHAALHSWGPAHTWATETWAVGPQSGDTLEGPLVLRGSGDPALTWDRLGALLRDTYGRGIRHLRGGLLLDRGAIAEPAADPAAFDKQPARAYNAAPDGLLTQFGTLTLRLSPQPDGRIAVVPTQPFAPLRIDNRLTPAAGECGSWKAAVAAEVRSSDAGLEIRLPGRYPVACGERRLHLAVADAQTLTAGFTRALWAEMGGTLTGPVRSGERPAEATLVARVESPPLADLLRDMNKHSNNVMARQILLALGSDDAGRGATAARARERLQAAMPAWGLDSQQWVIDNGSGLSREARCTAAQMGQLLHAAWASPRMPDFVASLPVVGVDGTMVRRATGTPVAGRAYVKSGTLDGVRAAAGYVLDRSGCWVAFVWLVNHPRATEADAALDALLTVLYEGAPAAGP